MDVVKCEYTHCFLVMTDSMKGLTGDANNGITAGIKHETSLISSPYTVRWDGLDITRGIRMLVKYFDTFGQFCCY